MVIKQCLGRKLNESVLCNLSWSRRTGCIIYLREMGDETEALPPEVPSTHVDMETIAKKKRMRLEELLTFKGMQYGSYYRFTVSFKGKKVMGLTWGVWDESFFSLQPQVILGADVLYDSSAFDNLFATVKLLLENSPGSVFITTYHNRSGHHLIEFLMVKWQLKCVKLLDGFSFLPSWKASGVSGNIQLVEIALSDVAKN